MKDITVLNTSVELDSDVFVNASANVVVDGELWKVEGHFDGKRFEGNVLDSDVFNAVSKSLREAYVVDDIVDYEACYNVVELSTKEDQPGSGFVLVGLSIDSDEGLHLLGGFEFEVDESGLVGMTNESFERFESGCMGFAEEAGIPADECVEVVDRVYDSTWGALVSEGFDSKVEFDAKLEAQEARKSFEV